VWPARCDRLDATDNSGRKAALKSKEIVFLPLVKNTLLYEFY
jgi:hypothetical protein